MVMQISNWLNLHQAWLALFIVLGLFVEFARERHPPSVIASVGAALFLAIGYIDVDQALSVFGNEAPITIAAMFVLSGAMVRTGALEAIATKVLALAASKPRLAVVLLFSAAFFGSAFLNNTPVVIVLIPVVVAIAAELNISRKMLLIPLSFVAILGGTTTLIGTSTNLLVNGIARDLGANGFGIFDITPIGLVAATAGIGMMVLLGRILLPDQDDKTYSGMTIENEIITQFKVSDKASFIGKPLKDIAAFEPRGIEILAITRDSEHIHPDLDVILEADDILDARTSEAELLTLALNSDLEMGLKGHLSDSKPGAETATVTVTVDNPDIGKQLASASFLKHFPVEVIGASRPGHHSLGNFPTMILQPGDRIYIRADSNGMQTLANASFILSPGQMLQRPFRRDRLAITTAVIVSVVALAALGVMPIVALAMIGASVLLFLRCIDPGEAWQSVEGDVLVLIFAMLIIGSSLQNTGTVDLIVGSVSPLIQGASPLVAIIAIYFLTSLLTEMVTNNAVAILLTPVAIALSSDLGIDSQALILAVMFAASASFATPIGYQTNTLVYAAGDYRFIDFVRIGLPMNLIVGLVSSFAIFLLII